MTDRNSSYVESPRGISYYKSNNKVAFHMCTEDYQRINTSSLENEGLPLRELAKKDSRLAYKLAKKVLFTLTRDNITAVTIDDMPIIDRNQATVHELTTVGHTLLESLPDEDTVPCDFSLSIYPSKEDIEFFEISPDHLTTLVVGHTEPPERLAA